ncbi:Flavin-containing monooxygenase FMO GS-OX3 [Hypsizygus marmoreus]|uniref:Flavin-containing monooxygenase FMO GS-OX3 n=1 Tax=Hypsizygus marmoreus TaxID=39966 RepID=A0A369K7B3_HYPMA|nr:Flavin-containing monooxygenase FMO GS-OX3 [Hypsizygus marmoreus]
MDLPTIEPESTITDASKTICIIGAGPAGLAALKIILDSSQYRAEQWKPTAFEARGCVGGVWVPAPPTPTDDPPLTPLYDSLTTNLPHPIMAFTSYSFPPSTPLFPHAPVVHKYLEDYADHFHLRQHIKLTTTVDAVERDASRWKVKISTGEILHFDLVLVCNGHYRVPRYPNTPGVAQWLSSGRAKHSAWYRRPHNLGDIVLVVGGGPSGTDISAEMRTAARTVIHSLTGAAREDIGNLKRRGRVSRFGENGEVTFEDGTTETGISYCILATGYEVSFPFLSKDIVHPELPPPAPPLPSELFNSTYSVFPLAKHLFPLQNAFPPTSLAFLGLLVKVAPFPLLEAQARAVVQAFANPATLNPAQEAVDIITRYEELRAEFGDDQLAIMEAWHRFKALEQFDYRDDLCKFAGSELSAIWSGQDGYMKVPQWEKDAYCNKDLLRKAWIKLEESNEAEGWVHGVGKNGPHEWIDLMERLFKWAKEKGIHVEELDKSKL